MANGNMGIKLVIRLNINFTEDNNQNLNKEALSIVETAVKLQKQLCLNSIKVSIYLSLFRYGPRSILFGI
jgi:hypothetical protein